MSIDELSLEEREIHINQNASDRSVWSIYTDDPVWIKRLNKIVDSSSEDSGITREEVGVGFRYTLPVKYVTIRPPRRLSEEQKASLRA
jgi:hypothetical protein